MKRYRIEVLCPNPPYSSNHEYFAIESNTPFLSIREGDLISPYKMPHHLSEAQKEQLGNGNLRVIGLEHRFNFGAVNGVQHCLVLHTEPAGGNAE